MSQDEKKQTISYPPPQKKKKTKKRKKKKKKITNCLGTSRTFDVDRSAAERDPLEEVMSGFVGLGGKVVDSSPMYGNAEEVVGDLAAKLDLRPQLFLATKVWTSGKQAGIAQMEELDAQAAERTHRPHAGS